MNRSVSTDLVLNAGTYSVLMKIIATRDTSKPTPEDVIRGSCRSMREKLLQIGLSYDLAHAKGRFKETEKEREEREEKQKEAEKKKMRDEIRAKRYKVWMQNKKLRAREKRYEQRKEEKARKKAEARKAAGLPDEDHKDAENADSEGGKATNGSEVGEPTPGESDQAHHEECNGAVPEMPSPPPEDRIKQFNQELDREVRRESIPRLRVNGYDAPNGDLAPPPDSESDLSFDSEFDSELDLPPSTRKADKKEAQEVGSDGPPLDDDAEFENDPWNAVCAVGLRVYSKDPALSVESVRPKTVDDTETPLDLDDPAAGATKDAKSPEGSVYGSKTGV